MIKKLKDDWREFADDEPGQRFQNRYHRRRENEKSHILLRIFLITLGAVIALSSLVLAPLPGPGWGTVFIGLMILGGELLPAARFLDWAEVRLRRLWKPIRDIWKSSVFGKIAMIAVAVILVAAFVYLTYYLLFGG